MRALFLALALTAGLVTGCGGDAEDASEPLAEGVYQFELTEQYLVENGIPTLQAENESGVHTVTLADGGFVDRWRTASGRTGACSGSYEEDGDRMTFRWESGCFGDWSMRHSVEGDVVTWSGFEALPPHDGEAEQKVTEVFNGVPWTRVGDDGEES